MRKLSATSRMRGPSSVRSPAAAASGGPSVAGAPTGSGDVSVSARSGTGDEASDPEHSGLPRTDDTMVVRA
jgi:hypothetical protein